MRSVGVLGAGALAGCLADSIAAGRAPGVELTAVLEGSGRSRGTAPCASLDELLEAKPDVVIEAASVSAVTDCVPVLAREGIDVVVLSVAAFADRETRAAVDAVLATPGAGRVAVPSGAVGGIDALRAAACSGTLASVHLTSTKPAPEEGVAFDGTAGAAAEVFPRTLNVAATVALTDLGFDATRVTLRHETRRAGARHRLVAEGGFGRIDATCENLPSPGNRQSSWLAALSALDTTRRLGEPLQVGS